MRVETHELFEQFQHALESAPEASVVGSLTEPPRLETFLPLLDPELSLDWSGQSFQGMPALREKILLRSGNENNCSIDDVLITAGTAEANFLAINQLVVPGDEIVVDTPGWPQPLVLAKAIGATLKLLPRKEDQAWAFDIQQLKELVTPRTKLIFICNPNNPTGYLMGAAELAEVIDVAAGVGAYVLTDEVYRGMEWEGGHTPTVAALYEKGISTSSVSKVLGLQGLRTGWMICRDPQVITDAVILREDSSEIMNIMGEAIADIALGDDYYPDAISRAREVGRRNLEIIDEFVASNDCLTWHRPVAGLIGFARLALDVTAAEFSSRLLAEPYRTFVMPGTAYGQPRHLRLGAGGTTVDLEKGLDRMQKFLSTLS
jgi:aspartate/methionine/tyrosine aminotransferase